MNSFVMDAEHLYFSVKTDDEEILPPEEVRVKFEPLDCLSVPVAATTLLDGISLDLNRTDQCGTLNMNQKPELRNWLRQCRYCVSRVASFRRE